ncbi:hypothetical protein HDC92_000282 [Pedobacter sp. AK017]|uniref:hypothetical protein n=1 Tax=Pedobacter sp. AK017 TaxID=2723073 RepID=UPI00160A8DF6|nr:hypothetical protein [Pedobacter sp. AK017]MBB5436618.1 hypothetical protein [Pedobacter sp. AK017]
MKKTSRKIKLVLAFCLVFLLPVAALADPAIYVCSTGTVTLAYTGAYTLTTGDQTVWQKVDASGTALSGSAAEVKTYNGTAGSENLTITGGSELNVAGSHYWRVHVISASGASCTGDPSDPIEVYMLPAYSVQVTPASAAYCIDGTTNLTKTVITSLATPANSATLPAGVNFNYAWVTVPGSGVGDVDVNDSKKFNMTTGTVGSYTVTSNVTYTVPAGKTLKSPGATPCTESGSTTITVTAKPAKPSISAS